MFSFDYQVLQTQLIVNGLLVDKLLHQTLVVQEFCLNLSVPIRFHYPGIALTFTIQEVLRHAHIILHGKLLKVVIITRVPGDSTISLS